MGEYLGGELHIGKQELLNASGSFGSKDSPSRSLSLFPSLSLSRIVMRYYSKRDRRCTACQVLLVQGKNVTKRQWMKRQSAARCVTCVNREFGRDDEEGVGRWLGNEEWREKKETEEKEDKEKREAIEKIEESLVKGFDDLEEKEKAVGWTTQEKAEEWKEWEEKWTAWNLEYEKEKQKRKEKAKEKEKEKERETTTSSSGSASSSGSGAVTGKAMAPMDTAGTRSKDRKQQGLRVWFEEEQKEIQKETTSSWGSASSSSSSGTVSGAVSGKDRKQHDRKLYYTIRETTKETTEQQQGPGKNWKQKQQRGPGKNWKPLEQFQ
jgi:hypothetical protein